MSAVTPEGVFSERWPLEQRVLALEYQAVGHIGFWSNWTFFNLTCHWNHSKAVVMRLPEPRTKRVTGFMANGSACT